MWKRNWETLGLGGQRKIGHFEYVLVQNRTFWLTSLSFSTSEFKWLPCHISGQYRESPQEKEDIYFELVRKLSFSIDNEIQIFWTEGECSWFSSNNFEHFCFLLRVSQDSFQSRRLLLRFISDNLLYACLCPKKGNPKQIVAITKKNWKF